MFSVQSSTSWCLFLSLPLFHSPHRLVDTASVYRNEGDIGKALKELGIPREEVFITSKLSPGDQGSERAPKALEATLRELRVDHVDLYLIHWPGAGGVDVKDRRNVELRRQSWDVLAEYQRKGTVRAVGVSNYQVNHLEDLLDHSNVVPQVRKQINRE